MASKLDGMRDRVIAWQRLLHTANITSAGKLVLLLRTQQMELVVGVASLHPLLGNGLATIKEVLELAGETIETLEKVDWSTAVAQHVEDSTVSSIVAMFVAHSLVTRDEDRRATSSNLGSAFDLVDGLSDGSRSRLTNRLRTVATQLRSAGVDTHGWGRRLDKAPDVNIDFARVLEVMGFVG